MSKCIQTNTAERLREKNMADVPEKQIKRLRALIQEAETNLAAANELLISLVGDDEKITPVVKDDTLGKIIEGVLTVKTWLVLTVKHILFQQTTPANQSWCRATSLN